MTEVQFNLKPGQETNEATYYYFLEVLPPIYHKGNRFQVSEAISHNNEGFAMYDTYNRIDQKYIYEGVMTKKQAKEYQDWQEAREKYTKHHYRKTQ